MEPLVPTIRQHLNKLTVLPSAARAVLIEVCELVENGGQGKCFAGNLHLANAACCHPISVSKHLGLLKKTGLLSEHFPNGNPAGRTLTPSPEVVQAYTTGDLSTLSRVLREGKQGAKATLSRVLADPKQGANHTHIHKGNSKDSTLEHPNVALSTSASADLARQLLELEELVKQHELTIAAQAQRLSQAKEEYRKLREEKLSVDASLTKTKEQLAKKTKLTAGPSPMPAFAQWYPEQVATLSADDQARLVRFHQWAQEQPLPHVFALNLTPRKVLALAAEHGAEPLKNVLVEMENSKALDGKKSADLTAQTWLKRDAARQLAHDSRLPAGNQFKEQRPVYGAQARFTDTTR